MSYIALATDSFEEMSDFYGKTLGFEPDGEWDRPNGRGRRFVLGGGLRLELLDNLRERNPMPPGNCNRVHVVIEVQDIHAAWTKLQDKAPPPSSTSWGASLFQIHDPDGVAVTFLQWDTATGGQS